MLEVGNMQCQESSLMNISVAAPCMMQAGAGRAHHAGDDIDVQQELLDIVLCT